MKFIIILLLLPVLAFAQDDSFSSTKALAEQGDAIAQAELGFMYFEGKGVSENETEAVKWFRLAAEQGVAGAQHWLAMMLSIGVGVPENHTESRKWFRLAAEQGHTGAQLQLGNRYAFGVGVPQNDATAYMWYSVAAALGHEGARGERDKASSRLSVGARNTAQQRATHCFDSGFKDCD